MGLKRLEQALDFRDNYQSKVTSAADYIRNKLGECKPSVGVVLGSGLGDLANSIECATVISYDQIPSFPKTTVEGHEGKLLLGKLEGVPVIGMSGRKHYYEVADELFNNGILQAVFPVHVMAELGVKDYFVTNASGGLNPKYKAGDIMVIRSHINLIPNPLLGRYHDFKRVDDGEEVWRFQPMNDAYDSQLRTMLLRAGKKHKNHIHEGTYLAVTGPTYETEGESIAFRDGLKADAVGMSITPEVIVARNRGMRAVGMSCITNVIAANGRNSTNHKEVKAILKSSEVKERVSSTVRKFFKLYQKNQNQSKLLKR